MAIDTWIGFFTACWLISLSPGAGAIASMSCGLQYGFCRGYWNAIGLQIALVVQIAIVAAGVGAILAASTWTFTLIKWLGVVYLIYLGVRQWRARPAECLTSDRSRPTGKPLTLLARGFLLNASNPKALIFVLAILPQFIDVHSPLIPQYVIIAATMISVDLVVMAGYTGFASRASRMLQTPAQQRRMNCTFAGLFIGAAGLLATLHRS